MRRDVYGGITAVRIMADDLRSIAELNREATVEMCIRDRLAVCAWQDLLTPWLLLGFTFLIGIGTAFNGPAWQASVGEICLLYTARCV